MVTERRPFFHKLLIIALGAAFVPFGAFAQRYDDAAKDAEIQPERVLDAIGVKPGMVVADAGTGRGYLAWKLASRVGPTGKVYANDIDQESLNYVEKKCREDNIDHVIPVLGKVADPCFPEAELDIVTMLHAFHDFTQPVEFLENLKKSLKPGGIVVVIDWRTILPQQRTIELFEKAGYDFVREETFLARDYVCIFSLGSDR
jgi:ubiquinone/menaquinone biosynthesis C-methylase UbiE